MPNFEKVRIRCELLVDDVREGNSFLSVVTSRKPAMYKGAQVEFQFALFRYKGSGTTEDPDELYDITNFVGLPKMRIRTTNAAGAVLLDETVADSVEKDVNLTLDNWRDDNGWHFRFVFSEDNTGITAGDQYIVIYGPDGDVFGRSTITVIDPGTGAGASPTVGDPAYYTKTDVNGKLLDYMKKQLEDDQGLAFVATNAAGERCKITLQPIWDEQGARLVPIIEPLT